MSNNEKLLKQLSLIDTIISNYNPSSLTNYSNLLGFETALDIHILSDNSNENEYSNYRVACDVLNIVSKRYENQVSGFFFTSNKESSIYEDTENTFSTESVISEKYIKHVLDILEKGKVKLSYKSEIKSFKSFESLLKKDKEYFWNMEEDHYYYYDMKHISSFVFLGEDQIIDRFNKIKRGTGFMEKRHIELSRSTPLCLFSEKIAYFASENLSKKYSEMFIDQVRDRTYRLKNTLASVKKQEGKGIVFSKEYKDYLNQCKENIKTFALFALNKKTSGFYGLQNTIVDLLHIDKSFALDIVCKTNLLSYQAREVLRKSMVS